MLPNTAYPHDLNQRDQTSPMTTNSDDAPQTYQDLILRPEFRHLRLRFPQGSTWIRILPGLRQSAHNWLLTIFTLHFPGGRFAHPATFDPNKRSAFDVAFDWFIKNDPRALRSEKNPNGYRFSPRKVCAFWVIEHSDTNTHSLKLVLESFGKQDRCPNGLAREIWRKVIEKDEHGFLMGNALDANRGVMVHIERCTRKRPHPPLDWVRLGRIPHAVDALLENVSPVDSELLRPLEQVIQEPTVDEQWEYLGRLISPELADRIRYGKGRWF